MTVAAMRDLAAALFAQAVAAADPAAAVRRHLLAHPLPQPGPGGRTIAIAIGKAAPAMLQEALCHVAGPVSALGVTHHDNPHRIDGVEIITAGHPVPDAAGLRAGQRILDLLTTTGPADRVVALISGGGSALVPAPAPPLTLDDKQAVNRLLLESGLDIVAMNTVRQQLSELKGGGFLRHAAPAPVTALILSDVIGDDLRAIASGPTVAPLASRTETRALLVGAGLWGSLPTAARDLLSRPDAPQDLPAAANHLIGSNGQSLAAMRAAAPAGWVARIVTDRLVGDVGAAAARILDSATDQPHDRPTILIFGGETTVRLRGTGLGGRNQELALRIALGGSNLPPPWVFLSGGTDGRDGPTDAAGGLVDAGTAGRIAAAGLDPQALLANNDSHTALAAAGDLLITGATGTNVADVQLLLLHP